MIDFFIGVLVTLALQCLIAFVILIWNRFDNKPRMTISGGTKIWLLNDRLHREDGPAVEWANGSKFWYLNDNLHREDGPAIEYADGTKSWWLNGKKLTEEQFIAKKIRTADA